MLIQVWRHQQEEQLPETLPQRSQTPVQQQQLGGKLMRYITTWETINYKDFIYKRFIQSLKTKTIKRGFNKQSHNVHSKGIKQKCKHTKRLHQKNFRKEQQKRFRKNKLDCGSQPFWFLNFQENEEKYQMQVF
ncbi:MAG: hypothetical protein EZS28_037401 [Streblomastix strix]|uniref:Uncharacterized protein n=1 Tax=Streblomastix strix TaxID=222440 RepID=A0A5J4UAY3_9EUKA|nr:MAG: hypothetical protein EZS28_037401 [Streblomastix strix]